MPQVYIRPTSCTAGTASRSSSSSAVAATGGEEQPLSGFYFREACYLRTLRLTLNGQQLWLAQAAAESPSLLHFDYVHPEMRTFGGGGSGQSGDMVETDEHGTPYRALDLRARYEVGVAELRISLEVTTARSGRSASISAGRSTPTSRTFRKPREAGDSRKRTSRVMAVTPTGGPVRSAGEMANEPAFARGRCGAGAIAGLVAGTVMSMGMMLIAVIRGERVRSARLGVT